MKTWSKVIFVNLALTAVGLWVWLDPRPTLGKVALFDLGHATITEVVEQSPERLLVRT